MKAWKIVGIVAGSLLAVVAGGEFLRRTLQKKGDKLKEKYLRFLKKLNSKFVELYCDTYIQIATKNKTTKEAKFALDNVMQVFSINIQKEMNISDEELSEMTKKFKSDPVSTFLLDINDASYDDCISKRIPSLIKIELMDLNMFLKVYRRYTLAKLDQVSNLTKNNAAASTIQEDDAMYESVYSAYKNVLKVPQKYSFELMVMISHYYFAIVMKKNAEIKIFNLIIARGGSKIKEKSKEACDLVVDHTKLTDEQCDEKIQQWKVLLSLNKK
jgi:hypothetical protein